MKIILICFLWQLHHAICHSSVLPFDKKPEKQIIGSNIVPSVSVILNGEKPQFTDAIGQPMPKPQVSLQVGSPINLLNPDRYEFYTFDDSGHLVKRLMTIKEIQSIVANGDGEGATMLYNSQIDDQNPEKNVQDIVNSVQSVLHKQVEKNKHSTEQQQNQQNFILDTPDVSSSWSMILPAIFGNTGDDIFSQNRPQQVVMIPDTDVVEPTIPIKQKQKPKPTKTKQNTSSTPPNSTVKNSLIQDFTSNNNKEIIKPLLNQNDVEITTQIFEITKNTEITQTIPIFNKRKTRPKPTQFPTNESEISTKTTEAMFSITKTTMPQTFFIDSSTPIASSTSTPIASSTVSITNTKINHTRRKQTTNNPSNSKFPSINNLSTVFNKTKLISTKSPIQYQNKHIIATTPPEIKNSSFNISRLFETTTNHFQTTTHSHPKKTNTTENTIGIPNLSSVVSNTKENFDLNELQNKNYSYSKTSTSTESPQETTFEEINYFPIDLKTKPVIFSDIKTTSSTPPFTLNIINDQYATVPLTVNAILNSFTNSQNDIETQISFDQIMESLKDQPSIQFTASNFENRTETSSAVITKQKHHNSTENPIYESTSLSENYIYNSEIFNSEENIESTTPTIKSPENTEKLIKFEPLYVELKDPILTELTTTEKTGFTTDLNFNENLSLYENQESKVNSYNNSQSSEFSNQIDNFINSNLNTVDTEDFVKEPANKIWELNNFASASFLNSSILPMSNLIKDTATFASILEDNKKINPIDDKNNESGHSDEIKSLITDVISQMTHKPHIISSSPTKKTINTTNPTFYSIQNLNPITYIIRNDSNNQFSKITTDISSSELSAHSDLDGNIFSDQSLSFESNKNIKKNNLDKNSLNNNGLTSNVENYDSNMIDKIEYSTEFSPIRTTIVEIKTDMIPAKQNNTMNEKLDNTKFDTHLSSPITAIDDSLLVSKLMETIAEADLSKLSAQANVVEMLSDKVFTKSKNTSTSEKQLDTNILNNTRDTSLFIETTLIENDKSLMKNGNISKKQEITKTYTTPTINKKLNSNEEIIHTNDSDDLDIDSSDEISTTSSIEFESSKASLENVNKERITNFEESQIASTTENQTTSPDENIKYFTNLLFHTTTHSEITTDIQTVSPAEKVDGINHSFYQITKNSLFNKEKLQNRTETEDSYIKLGESTSSEKVIKDNFSTDFKGINTHSPDNLVSVYTTTKPSSSTLKPIHYFTHSATNIEDKFISSNSSIQRPIIRPLALSNLKITKISQVSRPPVKLDPSPNHSLGLEVSIFDLQADIKDFAKLCNQLAFSYWRSITSEKISSARSLVISPFALTSMLSMVFLGARGSTSGEMNEILKLDDMVTFNPHLIFKNVTESVEKAKDSGMASSAFVRELFSDRKNGKILQFFKDKVYQFYSGHVEEVNFNVVNDIIRRRTNLLIKRHANGKVLEYLRTNSVWVNGPLSTISANLFQTDCSKASMIDRDGEMFFQVNPSVRQRRLVPIPAVVYRNSFLAGYDVELDATIVAFGNADETVSTIYVMPGQHGLSMPGDNLERLEKALINDGISKNVWSNLLTKLMPRPGLEIQLPRFSHRSFVNASLGLQKLGFKTLFDSDEADLRGLTGSSQKDIHLADMIQINTFSTCGEEKITNHHHVEMYPAPPLRKLNSDLSEFDFDDDLLPGETQNEFESVVQNSSRSLYDDLLDPKYLEVPLPLRPRQARVPDSPRLRIDKPFIYFVRHNPTGMILFMGRFNPRLLP